MAVKKLKSGKWQAIISYRDEDGMSRKKKKSFLTRREAKAFEYSFLEDTAIVNDDYETITYEHIFEKYLLWNSKKANNRTILDKRNMANRYWGEIFLLPFGSITPKHYLDIQEKIYNANYSTSRTNKYLILLMSISSFAEKFYSYPNSAKVLETLPEVKSKKENISVISLEELDLFLQNVEIDIFRILFNFLYFTGLRIGEARALQVKDINNGYVTVSKSIRSAKQGFNPPKNASSYRTNRLDDNTLKSLEPLLNQNKDNFLFGGIEPLSMRQIDNARIQAIKKAGMNTFLTHTLRHSFGSHLLSLGVNIKAVSVYMGHSTTDTTARVYEHMMKSAEDEMIETLNKSQRKSTTKVPQ